MKTLLLTAVAALAVLGTPRFSSADPILTLPQAQRVRVFVVTFGPGSQPWEKFGHNAIRIVNPNYKPPYNDVCYNWGYFDFSGENFIINFLQGKMNYAMHPDRSKESMERYQNDWHRDIRQQELNLTAEQKRELISRLEENDTDANRVYKYDYYLNNCSTKVRDVIDDLIDHRLAAKTKGFPSGTSFRFHTDRLSASSVDSLWLYVALQAVLGHPVEREIDRWEEMFLPQKVHDRLNEISVVRDGKEVPLVIDAEQSEKAMPLAALGTGLIYQSPRGPEPQQPPMMAPWLLATGVVIGGIFALLARLVRRSVAVRLGLALLLIPWLLLISFGGSLIWWGWLNTDHDVARRNENVMQISVLALPLLFAFTSLILGSKRWARWTLRLTCVMAGLSVLGLIVKVLPWFYQTNYAMIALCLPVNLALVYSAWVMSREPAAVVKSPRASGRKR